MSKIDRFNGDVKAFASEYQGTEKTTFGTTNESNELTQQQTSGYLRGWGIVGASENPSLEDFNAIMFTATQYIAYLHQMGVPEWSGGQEYQERSWCTRSGAAYICKTMEHVSATPPESDPTNWRLPSASEIFYDNSASGMASDTVQDSIDELSARAYAVYSNKKFWPTIANNELDADHDINFSAGKILGSDGLTPINLTVETVKQLDAVWVEGNNSGGLFPGAGTISAGETYHCFVIRKNDGATDCGFDTDVNCANIPPDYTSYKYIHSVLTDSSSNIIGFFQSVDTITLTDSVKDLQTGAFNLLRNTLAITVPSGISVSANLSVTSGSVVPRDLLIASPLVNDSVPSISNCTVSTSTNTNFVSNDIGVFTNLDSEITYKSNNDTASGTLYIRTLGWTINRG